ncbi:MAG: hypothetical protein ABSC54_10045 [Smithellaceae bacterium]|jgi:CRISPR/Cas system-associated exonuclease Cas4 (RecB family)
MIVEKILESKQAKIKGYPVNSNRASDLGHPCLKYHVLNRTKWQEKTLHDVRLQQVFDLGNDFEEIVLRELAEARVKIIEQQRSFSWPEYQITGHIDAKIMTDEGVFPLEIKSCSPFVFKKLETIDDLKRGKYLYLRKYPVQLNLYMLMSNKEKGVFLFKEKTSGQYKEIWMNIDYDLGEETLKRAEAINKHITEGTMPEPIDYLPEACDECPFVHLCLPDRIGSAPEIIDSAELETILKRLEEIKPLTKEYDELDDRKKEILQGKEKVLCGNYFITGKWAERKTSKGLSKYWKIDIIKMEKQAS